MRVVILGGSGFIGTALCSLLAARGDTVCIPSRNPKSRPNSESSQNERISFTQWDGKSSAELTEILKDADAVVNLLGENIAEGRWTPERKERIVSSRLRVGEAIVAAFPVPSGHAKSACTLIQASAVGIYGSWPNNSLAPPCTEDSPAGNNFLAQTAARWEASTAELESRGIRRCVIRTAPVLGQGGMLSRLLPLFRLGLGGPVGSGLQPFPWIHLHDEAAAIAFLLDNQALSGAFNLSAPQGVSSAEFSRTLGSVLHRPAFLPAPAFALRLLFGQMADELLLTGQNAPPKRLLAAGFTFTYPNLRAALAAC